MNSGIHSRLQLLN